MSKEEYLSRALAVLRQNFRVNDSTGSMTAASAAYVIKHRVGDHSTFGFPKFKDVLDALEGQGVIRQGFNSKQALAIWLDTSPRVPSSQITSSSFPYRLRKDAWYAFVANEPSGKRYLNPRSGEIQVGRAEPLPEPWVEIETIDIEEHKAKTRQFLEQHQIAPETFNKELNCESWYAAFPKRLSELRPDLAADWNRLRSSWVANHASDWCSENNIKVDRVFQVPTSAAAAPASVSEIPENGLRAALLEAIARMSTEELLRIHIPAEYLVAALRPDLVR